MYGFVPVHTQRPHLLLSDFPLFGANIYLLAPLPLCLGTKPCIYPAKFMTASLCLCYHPIPVINITNNHGRQFSIRSPSMSFMPRQLWDVSCTYGSSPFLQGFIDTEFHRAFPQVTTSAINSCPTCQ